MIQDSKEKTERLLVKLPPQISACEVLNLRINRKHLYYSKKDEPPQSLLSNRNAESNGECSHWPHGSFLTFIGRWLKSDKKVWWSKLTRKLTCSSSVRRSQWTLSIITHQTGWRKTPNEVWQMLNIWGHEDSLSNTHTFYQLGDTKKWSCSIGFLSQRPRPAFWNARYICCFAVWYSITVTLASAYTLGRGVTDCPVRVGILPHSCRNRLKKACLHTCEDAPCSVLPVIVLITSRPASPTHQLTAKFGAFRGWRLSGLLIPLMNGWLWRNGGGMFSMFDMRE